MLLQMMRVRIMELLHTSWIYNSATYNKGETSHK